MYDPRLKAYAKLMVHYALGVKPDSLVVINANPLAEPLLREVYREVLAAGAHPYNRINLDGLGEIMFKEASDEQLKYIPPIAWTTVEKADYFLHLGGGRNRKSLAGVDPKRMQISQQASKEIQERYMEREAAGELSWSLCQFPTDSGAQEANMSTSDYYEFVLAACLVNEPDPVAAWKKVSETQQKICDYLMTKKDFHVTAEGTDLRYCAEGRTWVNCDGKNNMPDGEVFTGPIEDSVNGHIAYSYPAIHMGKEVENVRLTFKDGKVVDATADKGEEFLIAMLDADEGARYVGEAAIGTNYNIKKFTKNMLFDEKIGGTCHFAVGLSIPESGGKNKSVIHWDMLCNLEQGGRYTADGETFYENGHFTKPITF
jgi:aminopeptidase